MLIVAVLQQKGGSGKTTLAVNFAAAAHLAGRRTLIIDMDPQGTALDWFAKRVRGSPLTGLVVNQAPKPLPLDSIQQMSRGYDVVLLDGPARRGDITLSAAVAADVVVLPVAPGPADFWALDETLESLNQADQIRRQFRRGNVRRTFVVNRSIPGALATGKAESGLLRLAQDFAGSVRQRAAFPAAMEVGESVLTIAAATSARQDITRIWRAVERGTNGIHGRTPKSLGAGN